MCSDWIFQTVIVTDEDEWRMMDNMSLIEIFGERKQRLIMKDKSASVLLTVSVGGSKALIRAAISPLCMSAACQMKMEGTQAFVCAHACTHKQAFNQLLGARSHSTSIIFDM